MSNVQFPAHWQTVLEFSLFFFTQKCTVLVSYMLVYRALLRNVKRIVYLESF